MLVRNDFILKHPKLVVQKGLGFWFGLVCCFVVVFFFKKWDSSVCVVYHLRRNEEILWKGRVQVSHHLKGKIELFVLRVW